MNTPTDRELEDAVHQGAAAVIAERGATIKELIEALDVMLVHLTFVKVTWKFADDIRHAQDVLKRAAA